jgi:hypothetical protein
MLPADIVTGITSALTDLNVAPDKVADVADKLTQNSDELGDSAFMKRLHVAQSAFGGSHPGERLGYHHAKAQEVIEDTLRGVIGDLTRFANATTKAVQLVSEADGGSAADLAAKQDAVAVLAGSTRYFEGDAANREARNEHLRDGGR